MEDLLPPQEGHSATLRHSVADGDRDPAGRHRHGCIHSFYEAQGFTVYRDYGRKFLDFTLISNRGDQASTQSITDPDSILWSALNDPSTTRDHTFERNHHG